MIDPEKVLWAKSIVEDVFIQNPDGPDKQVHSYSLYHFPEYDNDGDGGVFIKRVATPLIADEEPETESVYVKKEALPELVKALQDYINK